MEIKWPNLKSGLNNLLIFISFHFISFLLSSSFSFLKPEELGSLATETISKWNVSYKKYFKTSDLWRRVRKEWKHFGKLLRNSKMKTKAEIPKIEQKQSLMSKTNYSQIKVNREHSDSFQYIYQQIKFGLVKSSFLSHFSGNLNWQNASLSWCYYPRYIPVSVDNAE